MNLKAKKFRDPIHNFIHVTPTELKVIDSPIFQRTHNIKQLSLGYYVYHGAEHSRFGHMLGAMHLAGRAYDSLQRNTQELGNSFKHNDIDKATLRMAALLHDIGHPPFSHSLEKILDTNHEKYSQVLVKNHFEDILENADIEPDIVNNLIDGAHSQKPYLSKIVSGQLDVDRLDYLLRDSYFAGVSYGRYDLERIIDQLAIVDEKLVVLQGGYEAVEQLIFARYQMYQQVYFHKTKRSFELMLLKCGEILQENNMLDYPKLSELEDGSRIEEYIKCDDRWFLNLIFDEKNPPAVKKIASMIKNRKPYLETYSPLSARKKPSHVNLEPNPSSDGLEAIQAALLNALDKLKINDYEFLVDNYTARLPYKPALDYPPPDDDDNYHPNSISIYYKNNKLIEPIEKRSDVIFSLAKNQSYMVRGFVIPEKYETIRNFLTEFNYNLPKRDQTATSK